MLSHFSMSDSLQPYGPQPSSLLCPCNFPGKNPRVGCHVLLQGIFSTQRWNQVSSGSCIASRLFPAEPPGKSIQGIQPYSNWSGLYPSLVRGNLKPLKFPKWKECLCCSRWAPLTTPSGFMLKRWFRLRLTSTCLRIGFGHNRKTSHRKRTHELGWGLWPRHISSFWVEGLYRSPQLQSCRPVPVHGLLGTGTHSRRWANKTSFSTSHLSHYCLNHPPLWPMLTTVLFLNHVSWRPRCYTIQVLFFLTFLLPFKIHICFLSYSLHTSCYQVFSLFPFSIIDHLPSHSFS